jgi:ferredoxin
VTHIHVDVRPDQARGWQVQVHVDAELCQGHTLCAMRAPAYFRLGLIDGHSEVIRADVAPGDEALVQDAAASCPEQAIVISMTSAPSGGTDVR